MVCCKGITNRRLQTEQNRAIDSTHTFEDKHMKAKVFALLLASFVFVFSGAAAIAASGGCISMCQQCAALCKKNAAYFEKMGGKYTANNNVETIRSCAHACKSNAKAHLAKAANANDLDETCAAVCKKCSEVCTSLNDPKLKSCIEACNKCGSMCEKHEK
jgi:hypothetical protein